MAKRNSGPVIPWEMGTHEIDEEENSSLVETLRQVKASYKERQLANVREGLADFGFTEEQITAIRNQEDGFNLALETAIDLRQKVVSLEESLNYEQGINKRLEELQKKKKEAGQRKAEAERKFTKALEVQINDLFFRLRNIDNDTERENSINTYKFFIKNYLKNTFKGEGYSLSEDLTGLSIKFEDPVVALLFAQQLGEWQKSQYDEAVEKFGELQVQYEKLRRELKKKGLSETFIDGELQKELSLARTLRANELSIKDELQEGGDRALSYLPQIKEIAKLVHKMGIFYPKIMQFKKTEEKINYLAEKIERDARDNQNLREILETNQKQMEQYIEEAEKAQKEITHYQTRVQGLEKRISKFSNVLFDKFRKLGEYLEKNKVRHKMGYAKINGDKKPNEYLRVIYDEFMKMAETVVYLIDRHSQLKKENRELSQNQALMDDLREKAERSVAKTTGLRKMLESYLGSEEIKINNALGKRITDLQNVFLRYFHGFNPEGGYSSLTESITDGLEDHLISNHYLGILDDAVAMTETAFGQFQELIDSISDTDQPKQKLADKYNCQSFDELAEKAEYIRQRIGLLEKRKELEEKQKEKIAEFGLKKDRKFETVFENLSILVGAIGQVEEPPYLETEAGQTLLGRIYQRKQQGTAEELKATVLLHYQELNKIKEFYNEVDQAEKEAVEMSAQLDSSRDTVKKAQNLVKKIDRQAKKFQKQEQSNQAIVSSDEFKQYAEQFRVLSQTAQILRAEINTPADLIKALKSERTYWAESLKIYQEKRKRDAERLGLSA